MPQIQRQMSVNYAADLVDVDVPTIRLLMARYQEMIPTFMPVQALRESVWERVHIPKMHEALGEILVKGDSCNPKCALLFAILSAAAYHLDAVPGGPNNSTMMSWKEIGLTFRQRARARLEASLKTAGLAKRKEDYENMLLAMLSMVTLCVRQLEEPIMSLTVLGCEWRHGRMLHISRQHQAIHRIYLLTATAEIYHHPYASLSCTSGPFKLRAGFLAVQIEQNIF